MNSDTKKTYNSAVDNLLVGIGNDFDKWNNVDYSDNEVLDSDNKINNGTIVFTRDRKSVV